MNFVPYTVRNFVTENILAFLDGLFCVQLIAYSLGFAETCIMILDVMPCNLVDQVSAAWRCLLPPSLV
jgi:hypothetical protein